jgi:spore maturation protein CgeB
LQELLCAPARQLAKRKFIVAGPQYPATVEWPRNVRRIAHLSPRWHAEFYSASRFTLNVTRRDMALAGYSPSVRLFEAAACGTALISDNWPGLDSFFLPGKEILLPATPDDVVRYLTELSEAETRVVGEAAQERALHEHTSEHRAAEFERAVEAVLTVPQLVTSPDPVVNFTN